MRIDGLNGGTLVQRSNRDNASISNPQVGSEPRISTTVDNAAICDENIKLLGSRRNARGNCEQADHKRRESFHAQPTLSIPGRHWSHPIHVTLRLCFEQTARKYRGSCAA